MVVSFMFENIWYSSDFSSVFHLGKTFNPISVIKVMEVKVHETHKERNSILCTI